MLGFGLIPRRALSRNYPRVENGDGINPQLVHFWGGAIAKTDRQGVVSGSPGNDVPAKQTAPTFFNRLLSATIR